MYMWVLARTSPINKHRDAKNLDPHGGLFGGIFCLEGNRKLHPFHGDFMARKSENKHNA